jgi:hypothetical protein
VWRRVSTATGSIPKSSWHGKERIKHTLDFYRRITVYQFEANNFISGVEVVTQSAKICYSSAEVFNGLVVLIGVWMTGSVKTLIAMFPKPVSSEVSG